MAVTQPLGSGRDSYYYLVQLSTFAETGRLAYDTLSVGWLAVAAPLSLAVADELALQGTIVIFVVGLLYLVASLVWRLSRSSALVWSSILVVITSNLLTPLVTEFVAELAGLVVFAGIVCHVVQRGTVTWVDLCLTILCIFVHRAAMIWSAVLVGAVLVHGCRQPRLKLVMKGTGVVVVVLMTLAANGVSTRDGLPVLLSGWSWRSSTFRESAAVALAFLLWTPGSLHGKVGQAGLAAVAAFAIWNPLLNSDPGFNTVGSRLALVVVWILAVVGPLAVFNSWRKGQRVVPVLLCFVILVASSWPREIGGVSARWIEHRAVLDGALNSAEFSREGVHIAEHGVQFLLRLRANLDARNNAAEVDGSAESIWYWLNVDGQSRRFSEGYWVAPGWVQVPSKAVAEWLQSASEAEKITLLTRNWHLRPLVPVRLP